MNSSETHPQPKRKPIHLIKQEVKAFKKDFKTEKSGYEEYRDDITPDELFGKLNFNKVKFSELNGNLQSALNTNIHINWPGKPFGDKGKLRENAQFFQNSDGSTVYCLIPNANNAYEWSRITKANDNSFNVHRMKYNDSMENVIRGAVHFEIRHAQDPASFHATDLTDIQISAGLMDIGRETRTNIQNL